MTALLYRKCFGRNTGKGLSSEAKEELTKLRNARAKKLLAERKKAKLALASNLSGIEKRYESSVGKGIFDDKSKMSDIIKSAKYRRDKETSKAMEAFFDRYDDILKDNEKKKLFDLNQVKRPKIKPTKLILAPKSTPLFTPPEPKKLKKGFNYKKAGKYAVGSVLAGLGLYGAGKVIEKYRKDKEIKKNIELLNRRRGKKD